MADKFLDDLMALSTEAEEAKAEYTELKERTKEAKERLDGLCDTILQRLKRRREEDADPDRLRFPDDEPIQATVNLADSDVAEAAPEPDTPADPEAWRAEPIGNLLHFGLSAKTVELLADAKITTVGEMADWSRAGHNLTDIPGIGDAKAEEINDAFDSFWVEWQRQQAPRAESEPTKKRKRTA